MRTKIVLVNSSYEYKIEGIEAYHFICWSGIHRRFPNLSPRDTLTIQVADKNPKRRGWVKVRLFVRCEGDWALESRMYNQLVTQSLEYFAARFIRDILFNRGFKLDGPLWIKI